MDRLSKGNVLIDCENGVLYFKNGKEVVQKVKGDDKNSRSNVIFMSKLTRGGYKGWI